MKRLTITLLSLALATSLSACGQQPKDPGPDYADDEAMEIISDAFEARQDVISEVKAASETDASVDTHSMKSLESYVTTELEIAEKLRTRVFEDSEMQELVLKYLNTLDDALELLDNHPVTSADFFDKWNALADTRGILLKTFVDDYGLVVEEEYQDEFDEVIANGRAAAKKSQIEEAIQGLLDTIMFEKTTEYSITTYSAVVENTIGVDLGNCSFDVSLYDSDGVKLEDDFIYTSSWAAGEKVRFEFISEIDTDQIKLAIDYYEVSE